MNNSCYRVEEIYLNDDSMVGEEALLAIKNAIAKNNAVGTIVGYYDDALTILSVSDYLLGNLGYSFEEFKKTTKGSLKNLFYNDDTYWIDSENFRGFRKMHGAGEGQLLTNDGTPVMVQLYKDDSVDCEGRAVWILAVRVDWEHENVTLITEALQSGSWHMDCDEEGNIINTRWSHAFRKMLGYHNIVDFPDTLESWTNLLHPADYKRVLRALQDSICDRTNKRKYNIDYRIQMLNGEYQWCRSTAEIIRRKDGSARRIAGIFFNVDKEKKAMMQIQKSNAFHKAFTKSNLCEYYVDLQHNSFESLKVEPSLLTVFEESNTWDELIQNLIDNYVCEEYRQSVKQFYVREDVAQKLCNLDSELSLECQITMEGERRWIRNVIMRGELEGTQYAIIFLRDITEAKMEEVKSHQMMESNAAMEHLIGSMIRVVDHFAICDLLNDHYEYHKINIESKYPEEGKYSDFIKVVANRFKTLEPLEPLCLCLTPENFRRQLTKEDDVYKFEYCTQEEDIFRIASFVPLEWQGNILAKVLWISMDITEEKRIEIESRKVLNEAFNAAERANKAKTEFLSNMSHDIRTPMNAIVGLTALAGANIDNKDRVIECLSKITKSSRHLLGLINEVLDMARIESGKISLTEEEFDISELVDNLIAMVKPDIEEHRHNFKININHIEHEAVCGDSLRIQQIFTNLMSNAIKYTPDGGNITFSIEEMSNGFSELGCFQFLIEDNGIGISQEFQKIMFQPFSRADDHRTTKIQGTGLGMAITQNIVHMMNGNIKVESELSKGTRIIVTIYLKLQNKQIDKMEELMNLPVLVVDDDIPSCESTVAALNDIGIIGEWVTSGRQAITRVFERHERREDYFAIIMDWKMPEMDGIETAKQIRKHVGNEVTIIILTAYDYSMIEEEAREAGVDAFIEKPLFRSRLTAALKQIITGKPEKSAKDYLTDIAKTNYAGKRILLVEDNDLNREITTEIIGMTNVIVDTATNGKEAIDKISSSAGNKYDLVFMDIQMPVMNGYEATAAIRSLPNKQGKVPIIAMTANAFAEDVQMAKNTGMNGHIAKPLDFDKLNKVLKKWLQ